MCVVSGRNIRCSVFVRDCLCFSLYYLHINMSLMNVGCGGSSKWLSFFFQIEHLWRAYFNIPFASLITAILGKVDSQDYLRHCFRIICLRSSLIDIKPEVLRAIKHNGPVVALESTIITHGMPFPHNVKTAMAVEDIIRRAVITFLLLFCGHSFK